MHHFPLSIKTKPPLSPPFTTFSNQGTEVGWISKFLWLPEILGTTDSGQNSPEAVQQFARGKTTTTTMTTITTKIKELAVRCWLNFTHISWKTHT